MTIKLFLVIAIFGAVNCFAAEHLPPDFVSQPQLQNEFNVAYQNRDWCRCVHIASQMVRLVSEDALAKGYWTEIYNDLRSRLITGPEATYLKFYQNRDAENAAIYAARLGQIYGQMGDSVNAELWANHANELLAYLNRRTLNELEAGDVVRTSEEDIRDEIEKNQTDAIEAILLLKDLELSEAKRKARQWCRPVKYLATAFDLTEQHFLLSLTELKHLRPILALQQSHDLLIARIEAREQAELDQKNAIKEKARPFVSRVRSASAY
ncbi:MAG: hypothetical protein V4534_00810 [Myxococcota bacterium]